MACLAQDVRLLHKSRSSSRERKSLSILGRAGHGRHSEGGLEQNNRTGARTCDQLLQSWRTESMT